MIIDSIQQFEAYASVNKHFGKVISFLVSNNLTTMSPGRYPVDGDDVFLTLSENDLKAPVDAKLEAHQEYIDIQIVLSGAEAFGWKPSRDCETIRTAYNPEKDILFYNDAPDTYFTLKENQFVIFFPADAHAPLVNPNPDEKARVVKAIFKVRA